jgi:hypothetical protein
MKRMVVALTAMLFAVTCSVSKEEKMDLLDAIKKEAADVQLESKAFGSEEEAVQTFLKNREKGFAILRAEMKKILGDEADNLDYFYLEGLLKDIRAKGDNYSFGQAKRMTEKRLDKLIGRIKKL